jgi:ribosomal protein S27E
MGAIGIGVTLLGIVLVGLFVYRRMHLRPQMAGYASQRMCPACGLITPRSKATCLECGKTFREPSAGRRDPK